MCSIGLDVPFSSGLLRPLCDVVSPPSAESEPLCLVGYVTEVPALPCLDKKSGRATASSASSPSSPCGTGAGGDGGGGVFGLLRLGAGGVGGWCGDLSRPDECRAGLCRQGFLWGNRDCIGRVRFLCAGTGVHTLWCPRSQQWCVCVCVTPNVFEAIALLHHIYSSTNVHWETIHPAP